MAKGHSARPVYSEREHGRYGDIHEALGRMTAGNSLFVAILLSPVSSSRLHREYQMTLEKN